MSTSAVHDSTALEEFNVRAFGAKGDGAADDTAAIQAAIDAALGPDDPRTGVRLARGPVRVPAGQYRITAPLRVHSAQGFKLYGAGFSSRLLPVGALASVLDLNGIAYSVVEGLLIQGNGRDEAVENAIHYYWDRAAAYRSSTANAFRDLTVVNTRCVAGFRVGKPGDSPQVDNTGYFNLYLAGGWTPGETKWWQAGFHLGTGIFGNILGHHAYQITSSFWGAGVQVDATNYAQWGGGTGQNGVDFQANTLSYFTVQGVRSETSGRLFACYGRSGNTALYSLSDMIYSADRLEADGEFIRMTANGNLTIRNLQVGNGHGAHVKLAAAPLLAARIKLDGVDAPAPLAQFLSGVDLETTTVVVESYTESDLEGGWRAATAGLQLHGPGDVAAPRVAADRVAVADEIATGRAVVRENVRTDRLFVQGDADVKGVVAALRVAVADEIATGRAVVRENVRTDQLFVRGDAVVDGRLTADKVVERRGGRRNEPGR